MKAKVIHDNGVAKILENPKSNLPRKVYPRFFLWDSRVLDFTMKTNDKAKALRAYEKTF